MDYGIFFGWLRQLRIHNEGVHINIFCYSVRPGTDIACKTGETTQYVGNPLTRSHGGLPCFAKNIRAINGTGILLARIPFPKSNEKVCSPAGALFWLMWALLRHYSRKMFMLNAFAGERPSSPVSVFSLFTCCIYPSGTRGRRCCPKNPPRGMCSSLHLP